MTTESVAGADPLVVEDESVEGGPLSDVSPHVAARALLVGVFLLMAGNGLQGSLLGVRADAEGFSLAATGVVMACYFAGFLAGAKWAESLLSSVGHIRVFAALASTASAAVLLHSILISPWTWALMRLVTGACMAGLYVVSESWLNDLATNATRGRLLSLYMVASMGGLTAGQFLLEVADPSSFELFVLSSILVSASLIPVTLSATTSPPLGVPEPMSLRDLARSVPTGMVGAFWVGTSAGVLIGMSAVYAVNVGVSDARLTTFLAAPLVGSVVFQWPIGLLSDHISRRTVMLWVSLAGVGISSGLVMAPAGSWLAIALMFLLGGVAFPLYSLTIAFTADWLPQSKMTAASASLVRVNGLGAVLGPLVAAPLMSAAGVSMFFWVLAVAHGVIGCYILWRIVFRDALPMERQRRFVAFPVRASSVAANLIGRRRRSAFAEAAETPPTDSPD